MTSSERVILIKGDNSKWYEQAIFIVRKDIPQNKVPIDFVAEAEKIINGYLYKKGYNSNTYMAADSIVPAQLAVKAAVNPKKQKKNGLDLFLNIAMAACCVLLAAILYLALK